MKETPRTSGSANDTCRLTLFVAGNEPNSRAAQANLAQFCDTALPDRHTVEIVDVLKDFADAARHGVVVTPTLLVHRGARPLHVLGTLSDTGRLRAALGLESA